MPIDITEAQNAGGSSNNVSPVQAKVYSFKEEDLQYDEGGDDASSDNNSSSEDNTNNNNNEIKSEPETPWHVKRKALTIYLLIATSAISQTLIEPILPFMVEERMGITGSNASLIVGIISSALFFGECISMAPIGYLSDIYGRKWFMVALQIASFFGVVSFGVIRSWWLAALVRFFQGLAGGIHATSKAALTDISSEHNRSLMLAYIATTYAIARAFSSLIGVSLLTITRKVHHGNPYLVTSLIAGGICFTGVIVSFMLSETNRKVVQQRLKDKQLKDMLSSSHERNEEEQEEQVGANQGRSDRVRGAVLKYFTDFASGLKSIYLNRTMFIVTMLFCSSYFSNAASITLWTIISEGSLREYGLGFSALGTGIYIGVFGLTCAVFQVAIYKSAMKKLGLYSMFLIASVCAAIDMIMFSLAPFPYWLNNFQRSWWSTLFVICILSVNAFLASASRTILIPTLNGMIGNLTDLNKQGLVQGSIQTMGNLSKAFGPILAGTVYSASQGFTFPWLMPIIISCLYMVGFCVALFMLDRETVQKKNTSAPAIEEGSEEDRVRLTSNGHNDKVEEELEVYGSDNLAQIRTTSA